MLQTNPFLNQVPESKYYCYIITNGKSTYNGYTVNLKKRLRQHNGELCGGAKATCNKGPWWYIVIITSHEWTAVRAMQNEWTIRYPTRRRPRPKEFQGAYGRVKSLKDISKYVTEPVITYVENTYYEFASGLGLPDNFTLQLLSNLL